VPFNQPEEQKLGKAMVPKRLFFTKGVGKHKERLTSFELALRDAGIAAQNLVRVSSIFPPQAKLVPRKEGLKFLYPGEVVFAVVAENSSREPHRLIASSVSIIALAKPKTRPAIMRKNSRRRCWRRL
jgi:arginine decarboxylase